ncbi:cytochrome P450 2C42 [Dermacentor silvarum]|uniref:cytochrome P450 2C42 n=1 Tax=Dermacentor silvarum TaxID=543639 RepID=UPI002100D323|nr:cytochrome P450 2C42 [Dermacentor silvarum]
MDVLRFGTSSLYIVATTSVLAALLATLLRRHLAKDRSRRALPGPFGWPVLGKLNFSPGRISFKQSVQWSKKYGSIVGLKQGSVDVVILNDNEQIKEIFSRPELQDRPTTWGLSSAQKGFSTFSGQQWKENRDFSMRALAKLGLGSETMRQHIQFEARHLADTLASQHGHPVSSFVYVHRSHINSICRFLLGYRYDLDDPHFASLQEALSGFRLQTAAAPIDHRADWLRRVLIESLWPTSVSAKRRHNISSLNSVVRELVQNNEDTKNSGRAKSYIDLYMEKIREAEKHNQNQYFTVDNLVGNMVDILMGAATSGTFYLHWHLLNVASHADTLQAELQREIETVVGSDRLPRWEDHTSMPLTMATIWEMFRWKLATPFNIPRAVGKDTKMGDYYIKKGTVATPNLLTAHRDHKLWKNPEEFDPSRFLNPDGTATTKRPDGLLSFSVGRRSCPGENMAMVEMFLFLTTLLHQFRILPENEKPIIITPFGPSPELRDTKLRFILRKHS